MNWGPFQCKWVCHGASPTACYHQTAHKAPSISRDGAGKPQRTLVSHNWKPASFKIFIGYFDKTASCFVWVVKYTSTESENQQRLNWKVASRSINVLIILIFFVHFKESLFCKPRVKKVICEFLSTIKIDKLIVRIAVAVQC